MAAKSDKQEFFEIEVTQRGSITIPPQIRKNLGLYKSKKPFRFILAEKDGGLFLRPTATIPVRNFDSREMEQWIEEDQREK